MFRYILLIGLSFFTSLVLANDTWVKGPVIEGYGQNALIPGGLASPDSARFKVVFDVAEKNDQGGANNKFNSVARFINMHARAGVPIENMHIALVVHGKAGFDLLKDAAHQAKFKNSNESAELVEKLIGANVKVFLCGQSATHLGIKPADVLPGVQMSLSAMTANALLQQQGYTLNPF